MLRDMAFAFFFGATGLMDSWVIAFMVPNLARRLFGEGASSSSLIPVYSEQLHENPKDANRLACTVVTVVFVILAGIVLAGELIIWAGYAFFSNTEAMDMKLLLMAIMLPYMIMICVVAILGGILNSHGHFAMPAIAPVVLNVFIIGSLFFSGWVLSIGPSRQLYFVAFSVLAVGLVQFLIQLPPLKKCGVKLRPAWDVKSEPFRKIIFLMAPMILGLTATQINTLADVLIARGFSGSLEKGESFLFFGRQIAYPMWAGAASILFFSQRLYQFPLGVFGISLATAIFPVMSANAAKKDMPALCRTVAQGVKGAVFVALPAMVGLWLVRRQLVGVLFERGKFGSDDTLMAAGVLAFYALGLSGFFLQQVTARAFYSLKDSVTPTRSAVIAVVVNVILNLVLIWPLGAAGLALSTAICSYLQVAILLKGLHGKLGGQIFEGVFVELVKTVVNASVMFVVTLFVLHLADSLPRLVQLLLAVFVAASLYFAGSMLLKIEMLSMITSRKRLE